jgi:hypothetical protein
MFVSERFYKQLSKIRKNSPGKPEERLVAEVREVFFAALRDLPENMMHDLFNFYVALHYEKKDQDKDRDVYGFADHLGAVIDLFNREYDEANGPLSQQEWLTVKELSDEYAEEIDLETLTYIMNLLLSAGYIHR